MQSPTVADKISALQKSRKNIRNICIMAHVDHGKTTLADVLVAVNGVISQKLAGKLRYLDSRKDEQERGITMKSSAIALHYNQDDEDYLINLIDSPGHVDFTGEVSSAVQLCDGALIVVDVVEGVCAQTKLAIRQAWAQSIKMVLILNKMDRLITELKLAPLDAYIHLQQILEQVNAVVGELFNSEVLGKAPNEGGHSFEGTLYKNSSDQVYDWSSGVNETDDSTLYFLPDLGNVVFTSGIDGWGFGIRNFAKIYSQKLGVKEGVLLKTLWGDFYLNTKTKRIVKGAQAKAKKPLFVQLVLENVWAVYNAVLEQRNKEMVEKIVKSLNIKISSRDARHSDPKVQLQSIFYQWLPLAAAVLEMVCKKLPSPLEISDERAEKLMCTRDQKFDLLPIETQNLKQAFCRCESSADVPIIIYASKMFAVERAALPQERARPLPPEEIALKRELARQRHLQMATQNENSFCKDVTDKNQEDERTTEDQDAAHHAFIAFARVFSGTVKRGQRLYVLGPKHDPEKALQKANEGMIIDPSLTIDDLKSDEHITIATVKDLYILMGRELEMVQEVPAGNIFGIGNLDAHIIKTATISSVLACPPFTDLSVHSVPILRVALEPKHSGDMQKLVRGLKLLNQADASVKVLIQETGEHVIVTAGEVHLQRCLDDLRERFAKIDINVSTPIVPFRETIVLPPKVDMVNEVIEEKTASKANQSKDVEGLKCFGVVELKTPNKLSSVKMRAVPLPEDVIKLLDEYSDKIKALDEHVMSSKRIVVGGGPISPGGSSAELSSVNAKVRRAIDELKSKLEKVFTASGGEWEGAAGQVWSFGPRRCGPNILLSRIRDYEPDLYWGSASGCGKPGRQLQTDYDNSFISGFQLATNSGPLCEEPMRGVCFIVEDWTIGSPENVLPSDDSGASMSSGHEDLDKRDPKLVSEGTTPFGPFSGQLISTIREACRRAFQAQPQRLMTAMYSCNIQVTAEVLGKMYAVLGKRNGRILHGDLQEGSTMFNVTAVLPVVESFDFANEIRHQTSGQALPQLTFSHWEVVDTDPFWVPTTEEEYLLYGEKADSENRARKYMNMVRKRKGLSVDEKLVEHAEKQRTLMRKK